jgi:tyrosyl-tRNA synthetase
VDVIADLQWRGLVAQMTDAGLGARLASAPVTVYHGIDATADSLHVGNLLGVLVLQRLQRAGHRPIVLLGGGTTLIGDPSGKEAERPMRPVEEVRANVAAIGRQLERFLDFGTGPSGAVLVDNADWLCSEPLTDFLRDVGKHFTVNAMMAKDSVRRRLEDREQGISFTEFSYMLLQAFDYLHLYDTMGTRLQIGGSDQWGNITAGVDLVRRARGASVDGLTWPLLTRSDGTKFGKSVEGNVWLDATRTSPYEMFQFWFQADDADVGRLLRTFTDLGPVEIETLEAEGAERPQDRAPQRALARHVTAAVHGAAAASQAEQAAQALFGGDLAGLDGPALEGVFADAPSSVLPRTGLEGGLGLVELLAQTGVSPSRSAARREIAQGGIYLNNTRVEDPDRVVRPADLLAGAFVVVRRGKRAYHLLRFGE